MHKGASRGRWWSVDSKADALAFIPARPSAFGPPSYFLNVQYYRSKEDIVYRDDIS